jgi:hypothetical protein
MRSDSVEQLRVLIANKRPDRLERALIVAGRGDEEIVRKTEATDVGGGGLEARVKREPCEAMAQAYPFDAVQDPRFQARSRCQFGRADQNGLR